MDSSNVNLGLVQDINGLNKLRQMSNSSIEDKKNALVTAAQQFESILNQFWVKAMRESNDSICSDSPLKSNSSSMFESMLDEQMITGMAKANTQTGSSLTNMIVKQFAKTMGDDGEKILKMMNLSSQSQPMTIDQYLQGSKGVDVSTKTSSINSINSIPKHTGSDFSNEREIQKPQLVINKKQSINKFIDVKETSIDEKLSFTSPKDFVKKVLPIAQRVAMKFNMNPLVLVAQAALETGWGKSVGSDNNFFGIKNSKGWNGESTLKASDEYINGKKVSQVSSFRSYENISKSFEDYARLISTNDRYSKAYSKNSDPVQYFEEIQKAGYATDPNYAYKLKNVIKNDAFKGLL